LPQKDRSGSTKAIESNPQITCLAKRAGAVGKKQAQRKQENVKALQFHFGAWPTQDIPSVTSGVQEPA
jgi:hypothetical protein